MHIEIVCMAEIYFCLSAYFISLQLTCFVALICYILNLSSVHAHSQLPTVSGHDVPAYLHLTLHQLQ